MKKMDEETLKGLFEPDETKDENAHRIGLNNVKNRMKEIYSDEGDMKIESVMGAGTRVIFTLPFKEKSKEETDSKSREEDKNE